ncbi:MAG: sensor histidine kinase [Nitrospinota bacterium]
MKKNLFDTNSLLLALFFCCLIYVLDVYVDVYVFKEGNVVQQFFFPENFELYFRGLISLVFIVFGLITSRVIQKLKLQEAALQKTQRELTESKEEAEEATLLKDKFLSLVAHDLQAPSSVVANLIHLVLKDKGDPICREHREILVAALESCNKMKVFVKDVLTVCRIKSGKIKPLARFDYLGLFITKAVNTYVKIAEKKGITVINNVPNEKRVYADFVLLSQVIENLLFNALKYSSRGDSVTFYIPEDDPTTFAVKDTGVGIVSTILPTIFSYDVAKSTKGTAGEIGTGLGLPLCRDLLLAHGGDLTVTSKKGEGSIFYAKLPYCKPIIMITDFHGK